MGESPNRSIRLGQELTRVLGQFVNPPVSVVFDLVG